MRQADLDVRRWPSREAWQDHLACLYQDVPASRGAVVEHLLPIAGYFARKFKTGEEPLDDLTQVASLALIKALERYDRERPGHFISFAAPTISGELRRHYRDTGWAVHVPRGLQELAMRVVSFQRTFAENYDRAPTLRDVAETLGVGEEDVLEALAARGAMRIGSLDEPLSARDEDAGATRGDAIGTFEAGYASAEDRAVIGCLSRRLSDREKMILTLRYADDRTQKEIGEQVGVSQMHVSRLLRQAVAAMEPDA